MINERRMVVKSVGEMNHLLQNLASFSDNFFVIENKVLYSMFGVIRLPMYSASV